MMCGGHGHGEARWKAAGVERTRRAEVERWGRERGESREEGELDGDRVGPVAGKGDPADSRRKDGRSEGLMDLAAWIDGDRSEIVEMRGG